MGQLERLDACLLTLSRLEMLVIAAVLNLPYGLVCSWFFQWADYQGR